jgi:antitoxin MazE
MEANLINVGNSKGIIIPSKFLKLLGISGSVEIVIVDNNMVVSAISNAPRKGWEDSFKLMRKNGDDTLLFEDDFNDNDLNEWTW